MSDFEKLKVYAEDAMRGGDVCTPIRVYVNNLMAFLESQVKYGKLNSRYEEPNRMWFDYGDYAPDKDGEYVIRIKGGLAHYAFWNNERCDFRLKVAPDIYISDDQILEYREV